VAGSLAALRLGGSLVEISKRDIWSAAAAGAERPDVVFRLLAVDFLPEGVIQQQLATIAAGAAAGVLRPLPVVAHGLGSVAAAMWQMSQARHVGKIVVTCQLPQGSPITSTPGRVVITGGTGSLGSLVARWLAAQGVAHIQLVSRAGKAGAGSAVSEQLASSATPISVTMCDAGASADAEALRGGCCGAEGLPLLGVFHAGGVLADATLQQQSLAGIRAVAAAKTAALEQLRRLLAAEPAQALVLFSSVASLLGSPGQANYSATNAALDAAAAAQQLAGVPATSVQWGAWAGAGMAANDAQTAARVERLGLGMVQPAQGLAALQQVLRAVGSGAPEGQVSRAHESCAAVLLLRLPGALFCSKTLCHRGHSFPACCSWARRWRPCPSCGPSSSSATPQPRPSRPCLSPLQTRRRQPQLPPPPAAGAAGQPRLPPPAPPASSS
jgi:hypothetical protein